MSFNSFEFIVPFFFLTLPAGMPMESNELYEFGDFRLDVVERNIERTDGTATPPLPEKPFQTLVHLVRNSGRLVTKEELISSVWPDAFVEENNLGKAIHSIRHCLNDSSSMPRYIKTVPKHGYRFVASVKRTGGAGGNAPYPLTASAAHAKVGLDEWESRAAATTPSKVPSNSRPRMSLLVVVIVAALAIMGLALGWAVLRPDVSDGSNKAEASSPVGNEQAAYDLFMRGKVKVASENREDTSAAIDMLEQAVSLNPGLAAAHAHLARAYNTMAFKFSSGAERKRYHEMAEVSMEKSLTLDPNLAEGHFARGLILWSNTEGFPHEFAVQQYKRSLAIDASQDETHHQLSLVYSHIGLIREAEESVKRALEINPNNTLARFRVGVYLQYRGRFDEALTVFKTIPRDHTPVLMDRSLAETMIQAGRLEEAEAIADDYLQRFPDDDGGGFTGLKALLLAKVGKHDEAETMALRAAEIGIDYGHFHHTAHNIAAVYAAMGRADDAVLWLKRAADGGFPNHPYFVIDPNLAPIRRNAQFVRFMAELKTEWQRLKQVVIEK